MRNILKIRPVTYYEMYPVEHCVEKSRADLALEERASVDVASQAASQRVKACNTGALGG